MAAIIVPKPTIQAISRSAGADASRESLLRLDRNELVPEWNSTVFDAIISTLTPASFSAYPAVDPLYEQLATSLGVHRSQLLFGAGSDWLIRACFDTFCRQGDRVVLPVPTYGMYEVYAKLNDARLELISYRDNFEFPIDAVLHALVSKPRILGLASPNGALGSAISDGDLGDLLAAAHRQDTLVVLDEAYLEYAEDRAKPMVAAFDNLILVRTFSKAGGLAGLRVGYALAQPHLIGWIAKLRPNVEINQVAVVACRYLLSQPEVVRQHVADTLAGKHALTDRLRACGFEVYPGAGNFIQVRLGPHRERILKALTGARIVVKDQAGHGLLGDWTRITVGPVREMSLVADLIEREAGHGSPIVGP